MKSSIIKIGNSKGVRIPKALLDSVEFGDAVEIKVKNGSIVISPLAPTESPYNEEYLMSLKALDDWNNPEEDQAWASLQ